MNRIAIERLDLRSLKWRHHGLGMLQAEWDQDHLPVGVRVHVWHPNLRTISESEGFRDIHDHRFDLRSWVVVGEIIDVSYRVMPTLSSEGLVGAYEIKHAKIQDGDDSTFLGMVDVDEMCSRRFRAGESYSVRRGDWHTTHVTGLAVTIIERSNFRELPARVLGHGQSAIVRNGFERVRERVLMEATGALRAAIEDGERT